MAIVVTQLWSVDMLKSNWTKGGSAWYGARVIRQRVGQAPPAKSQAPHKCMSSVERALLCQRLERQAG